MIIEGEAADVIGTSAFLVQGDSLTLNELLYGLMLPSGNDAAHQLASYFGTILLKLKDDLGASEGSTTASEATP